jgi:phage terminase Nu1 subunit (DNA packaging protein)
MAGQNKGKNGNAEGELEIGGRRYVNKERLASILGVSARTLSRWDAAGTGPPKIKVGRKALFDLLKVSDWLTSRET